MSVKLDIPRGKFGDSPDFSSSRTWLSRTEITFFVILVVLRFKKGWGRPNLALMVTWPSLNWSMKLFLRMEGSFQKGGRGLVLLFGLGRELVTEAKVR